MVEFRKFLRIKEKKRFAGFLRKLLKRYLANSSIHGVRYLVEDGRHWTERIFWLICCGLSWWGCIVMVHGVFADFSNRPIATTVETNYLNWRAELPSIHVCYYHTQEADNYIKKTWTNIKDPKRLTNVLTFGYSKTLKEPHDAASFDRIAETLHVPCEEIFDLCEWNDEKVNCCTIFHPLWTPAGRCHSVNSMYTKSWKNSAIEDDTYFFRNPANSGVFTVVFRVRNDPKAPVIYVLNKLGLPTITTGLERKVPTTWKSEELRLDVVQQPTYNEEGVRMVAIKKRNCRFANERENIFYYDFYGYDPCLIEGLLKIMMDKCGCVSHLYPRNAQMQVCDQKGLACLTKESASIFSTSNLTCVADCEETSYGMYTTREGSSKPGHLHVHLLPGPTLRYRRYVVHGKLDLVVAVGGAIGLFVGASVLSIVEVPYWLIIRSFDDDDDDDDNNYDDNERVDRPRVKDDRRNSLSS